MLLAIDTSTRVVGIALYDGVQVLGEVVWVGRDHHTSELAPTVAATLARARLGVDALQALAVATGPGSFTGLRIGLALAKGMALALRIPLIGVRTLDALAAAQPVGDLSLAAVLRAGRGRLAVGWYRPQDGAWTPSGEVEALALEEFSRRIGQPTLVCGELSEEERRALGRKRRNVLLASPVQSLRRPSYLAELGWRRWQAGQVDDPVTLAPFYLHHHEAIPG